MKQNKNKKKWTVAAASLAIIAALAGTFAWFTSQDSVKNEFETEIAGNDVEIVETFIPPKDWKPGQDVKKEVAVANTGNYKSLIRVSLTETLEKLANPSAQFAAVSDFGTVPAESYLFKFSGDTTGYNQSTLATPVSGTVNGQTLTLKVFEKDIPKNGESRFQYISYWEDTTGNKYYSKLGTVSRAADGKITPAISQIKYVDLARTPGTAQDWRTTPYNPTITISGGKASVSSITDDKIKLNFVNLTNNPTEEGKWYYNTADGYFYYIGVVAPQNQTAMLLESVTLDQDADNTYSKLKYDLDVNAEGIQAIAEAAGSTSWAGAGTTPNTALVNGLKGLPNLDTTSN